MEFSQELFLILAAALSGGLLARLFKAQPIVGYILAGVGIGAFFPAGSLDLTRIAEVGIILLLFSIGIEVSLARLSRVFNVAVVGGIVQIVVFSILGYLVLLVLGLSPLAALILAAAFSLSSTAVVVKILSDRGETGSIHGEVMIGWLLVQDLAVIPMMIVLSSFAENGGADWTVTALRAVMSSGILVLSIVVAGRLIAPRLIHKIASVNSRELLVLSAIALAMGIAALASLLGISPALGAFLAGVVISETQENHAIFAETRPLRDIFMALFFVTLGFLVIPSVIFSKLGLILSLVVLVLFIKFIVVLFVMLGFGYHGKTAITTAIGLSQIGEFSFIIFSQARFLGLISGELASVGIWVALITIILTPLLFAAAIPLWRRVRALTGKFPALNKLFVGWDKQTDAPAEVLSGHIIICGFGRVGGWVGKALRDAKIPFVVIDYNQKVVSLLRGSGENVVYGDPSEPEVLEIAGIKNAKAIVVAIPDRVSQETLVTHVQTIAPGVKIITRAHFDEDWDKLKLLKVDKIVQPEFEAAIAIIRSILTSMGKPKEEISISLTNLRHSHSLKVNFN